MLLYKYSSDFTVNLRSLLEAKKRIGMSEYAALHAISLLLVGKNPRTIESSAISLTAAAATKSQTIDEETISKTCDPVPSSDERQFDFKRNETQAEANDTGVEIIMQPSNTHQKEVLVLPVDDLSAGPNESRWRAHGMARRRKLLEEDQRMGGRDFSMSFDCSVQRYFSVAHWYVLRSSCTRIVIILYMDKKNSVVETRECYTKE